MPEERKPEPEPVKRGLEKSPSDAGAEQVQQKKDEEEARGYVGTEADPTPDENYTVAGVTAGKPTPETDEAAAAKARQNVGLR